MATEDNHPSLYSALYNAITDHRLIDALLQHPEFRNKAEQICRRIAGPAGGEELLQETCLRLLECASDLNSDDIRDEDEFFGWFSQLARRVHLSNVLSATAVSICTEKQEHWPDSLTDVPSEHRGRFLAHADACPYHARILRSEEEALRAACIRARGLDSQGRILLGDELHAKVAEHRRLMQSWRAAALRKDAPFGHVALFNGGSEVASCGKFYDFSIHQSRNELDPDAGLQIYGVSSGDPNANVLLGFYALAGARHEDKEQLFELDNGYTIGLKVEHLGETTFEIYFRCVETKTLEAEPDAAEGGDDVIKEDVLDSERFGGLPIIPDHPQPPIPGPSGWWPLSRGAQMFACLILLLVIAFPCLLIGKAWAQMEGAEASAGTAIRAQANTVEPQVEPSVPVKAAERRSPTQGKEAQPVPRPPGQTSRKNRKEVQPHRTAVSRLRGPDLSVSVARSTRESSQGAKTQPEASARKDGKRRVPSSKYKQDFMVAALRGSGHIISYTKGINQVSTVQLLSYEIRGNSTANSALHIITDEIFGDKLDGALQGLNLHVKRVAEQIPASARVKIQWIVQRDPSSDTSSFVITVNARIFRGSEKNSVQTRSYTGEGNSLEEAYDDVIGKAIKPVIKQIRGEGEEGLSTSASETSDAAQLETTLPGETFASGYKDCDGANTDHVELCPSQ